MSAYLLLILFGTSPADAWPAFRGTGDSRAAVTLPVKWGDEEDVRWAADLSGYGQSSPVVWKDAVFVTSVTGENKETLTVACFSLRDGGRRWEKEFAASQPVKSSDYVSKGAPTAAVDGSGVYAFFESGDLVALTHVGEVRWQRALTKDYGPFKGNHGLGSSPALTDDAVVLLVDHSGPSYLLAVDKRTGETLWKQDREDRVSWSSPVVAVGEGGPEILISSNGVVEAYSAVDGSRTWWVEGLKGNTVASPTVSGELVTVGSGEVGMSLAVRRGGSGDVSSSHVAWRADEATSSFGSPLVHDGRAYFVSKAGVAYCLDAATGRQHWARRLPDSCWASPVGAWDRVYFFCKNGQTVVVKAADEFEKLAENSLTLDGRVYGVAAVEGALLIRTGGKLVCVGGPAADEP